MSTFALLLLLTGLLTLLGSGTLAFITIKYYWGDRGRPPLTGAQRKAEREKELQRRAKQIEYVEKHPIPERDMSFFGKRK